MTAKFHSFQIGNIDCTVLLDGVSSISIERFLRRFPDASEQDYRKAFTKIGQSLEQATSAFNILLLKMDDEVILVDAGEAGRPYGGDLVASMKLAEIDPQDITLVIITHSHGDHILGLVDNHNHAVFPNAHYVMSQAEFDFWRENIVQGASQQLPILSMMRQNNLRLIDMDEEIIRGIKAIPLQGHTDGQIGLLIESQGEALLHLADLLHSPIQFAHLEWSVKFDADAELARQTRQKMLTYAAAESLLTLFYHLDFPSLGYVKRDNERGFTWHPIK